VPEVHALVHLLTCMFLIDEKQNEQAAEVAKSLLESVQAQNRRSMDILSAKVYYFFCLTQEHLGNLDSIRPTLLQYHRTATLQHNEPGQSALVVCILRSFLHYKLYEQADKFRLNTTLPENRANDVHARYLYYLGQINAVQLQYSDAFSNLTQVPFPSLPCLPCLHCLLCSLTWNERKE
jgi:26S proteasome regulatory subunit N3